MPSTVRRERAVPTEAEPCRDRRLLRLSWALFVVALLGALVLLLLQS